MYRCNLCQQVVPPRTPANRLVVETRERVFPHRSNAQHVKQAGKKKKRTRDDPGGVGTQIVQEILVCPTCAAESPEVELSEYDELMAA